MIIIILGPPGSGKSILATKLAGTMLQPFDMTIINGPVPKDRVSGNKIICPQDQTLPLWTYKAKNVIIFRLKSPHKFQIGDYALRANRSVEPMRWVEFVVNETYLPLIEEFPEDYRPLHFTSYIIKGVYKTSTDEIGWRIVGLYGDEEQGEGNRIGPTFPETELEACQKLLDDLVQQYGLPVNGNTIIRHFQNEVNNG